MVIELGVSVCLLQGILSVAAKVTRQELSPKVLLIADKSHLAPCSESILGPKALLPYFYPLCELTDICKLGLTLMNVKVQRM